MKTKTTPQHSFRLLPADLEMISKIMKAYKLPTKIAALRLALIMLLKK